MHYKLLFFIIIWQRITMATPTAISDMFFFVIETLLFVVAATILTVKKEDFKWNWKWRAWIFSIMIFIIIQCFKINSDDIKQGKTDDNQTRLQNEVNEVNNRNLKLSIVDSVTNSMVEIIYKDRGIIENKKSTNNENENPVLTVAFADNVTPYIHQFNDTSWAIGLKIENVGTGNAYKMNDKYIFISSDQYFYPDSVFKISNGIYFKPNTIAPPQQPFLLVSVHFIKKLWANSFVAFELSYTNDRGIREIPLKKTYIIKFYDSKPYLSETTDEDYKNIDSMLVNKKIW